MKKRTIKRIGLAVFFLLCIFVFWNRKYLSIDPLKKIAVDSPNMVINNTSNGNTIIADRSGKRLYEVNKNNEVTYLISGSRTGNGFYEAKQMYTAKNGDLYVLDLRRLGSRRLEQERVLKYSSKGKFKEIVSVIRYGKDELNYKNKINRFASWNGKTVWFQFTESGFNVVSQNGIEKSFINENATRYLVDFAVNPVSQKISYLTKTGEIYTEDESGGFTKSYSIEGKDGYWIPWYINYDKDGSLLYADIGQRAIFKVGEDQNVTPIFFNGSTQIPKDWSKADSRSFPIYYNFDVGENLVTTDTEGIISVPEGQDAEYFLEYSLSFPIKLLSMITWISLGIISLALLAFLFYILREVLFNSRQYIKIVAAMLGGTLLLTVLFTMIILQDWTTRMTEEMTDRTTSVSGLAAQLIPGDNLKNINTIKDFYSEDYEKVRDSVRDIFVTNDPSMSDFYCVIYRIQDEMITAAYSIEEYAGTIYPYNWPYEDSDEQHIITEHIQKTYMGLSASEGSFIFTNSPILDSSGNAVGILEVGTDLYNFQQDNQKMVLNVLISAVVLAITMILIVSELLIFFEGKQKRKSAILSGAKRTIIPASMLRIMVFMIFFVTNMPKGFLPMYILKKAETEMVFGLSPALLVSLALSAEVLFGALTSMGGNKIFQLLGRRKTALLGSVMFVGGLSIRAFIPTILSFIVGNAIMGAGWGFLLLLVQIIIAEKNDEEKSEGFTGYTAASLSGVNCGVVFGAFLIGWMNYLTVLFVISVLSAVTLIFCYFYIYDKPEDKFKKKAVVQKSGMSTLKFIFSPRVLLYFFGIMIPVVAGGYFLAYLYPLLGDEMGISETNIGYSYLINGICIICLGSLLTKVIVRKFRQTGALLSAALLYAVAFILYAFYPNIITLFLTLILLGISDSFGLPVQSTYFTDLEEVREYGYDKAMGIYSLIENMSQVFGSFVFGIIYVNGVKTGLIYAGIVIAAAAILFLLCSKKREESQV